MGWESRGGKRYFYTATRTGDRVVKHYHGAEESGESVAALVALEQQARAAEKETRLARRREHQAQEAMIGDYLAGMGSLAALCIEAEGFHRPGRGRWRKRRAAMDESALIPAEADLLPTDPRERKKLFARVYSRKATEADYRLAARILRETPEISPGYGTVKGFMHGGLSFLVSRCIGPHVDDEIERRMLEADARNEAEALAGPGASPAIQLLAARVVGARLHLAQVERRYQLELAGLDDAVKQWQEKHASERVIASLTKNYRGMTPAPKLDRDGLDRRLERAQRMYLTAIKALTDAQKLPLPTVQMAMPGGSIVNLAEKQINLSQ